MYDELAASYHLMFEDWDKSIERQAAILGPIVEAEAGQNARILDCACGIGTQSIGLAQRGHRVTGSDRSTPAVDRARIEASQRGLDIVFHAADMRDLSGVPGSDYDLVLCADNALPHLESDPDIRIALRNMALKLRPGGSVVITIRDYDRLTQQRPVLQGPFVCEDGFRRRIVHQLWDWIDQRRYWVHIYITRELEEGWESLHFTSIYRSVLRDELTTMLSKSFEDIRWLMPEESRYYQPIVMARKKNALQEG